MTPKQAEMLVRVIRDLARAAALHDADDIYHYSRHLEELLVEIFPDPINK